MSPELQITEKQSREKQIREKRREFRRHADGEVQVQFSDPRPVSIQGRLMDISPSGFRMAHETSSLETGQIVQFKHSEATGRARVMWNRILDTNVETGFLVIT